MYVQLRIYDINFLKPEPPKKYWWENESYTYQLTDAFRKSYLWDFFHYYGAYDDKKLKEFNNEGDFIEYSCSWKPKQVYVLSNKVVLSDCYALLYTDSLRSNSLGLRMITKAAFLVSHKCALLSKMINFTKCLHCNLAPHASLGPTVNVEVGDITPQRKASSQIIRIFGNFSIVNFIDRSFFENYPSYDSHTLARILTLPMPQGTLRLEEHGLTVLKWVENIEDESVIVESLRVREEWFSSLMNIEN